MPLISQNSIKELNEALDAVAVASDYVKLEKRGGRFWACCPFHDEKTPSFTVNPDTKSYYCFGCHKGGSVLNMVMELDTLSFPEAVELMAKKFSIPLTYENDGRTNFSSEDTTKKIKEDLYDVYKRISGTFTHFLANSKEAGEAKNMLANRGISHEMIENFKLGFSPFDRYWLFNFLLKKSYSKDFLKSSGLFSSRYEGLSLFSGRLMFPISDRQGKIIAFGGRSIKDDPSSPKYINSPESLIYKKRDTLYGLNLALGEIKKTKKAYIAEGYIDVIALHQAGITNAVAPLGTSFTEDQAKLLKRWADELILFFDTDQAGEKAANAAILTARKCGLSCSLVHNDNDSSKDADVSKDPYAPKDPGDILQKFGPEILQSRAKSIIFDFEYLIKKARIFSDSGTGGQNSERKAQALTFLFPYIDLLGSELSINSCIEAAADSFGLLPALVAEEYRRHKKGEQRTYKSKGDIKEQEDIRLNDELSLLLAVAVDFVSNHEQKFFNKFCSHLDISEIEDPYARELYLALMECRRYEEISLDDLLFRISKKNLRTFFNEHISTGEFSVNFEQILSDGIKRIRGKRLKKQQEEIIIKLRTLKNKNDSNDGDDPDSVIRDLLSEKMRIDSELFSLEQGRLE